MPQNRWLTGVPPVIVFLALILVAARAGPGTPSPLGLPSQVSQLEGTYTFLKDSDGAVPPAGVKILLAFSKGNVVLVSDPPEQAYTDSGTYQFQSGTLQRLVLPRLGKFVSSGSVSLQYGVLTLPFKLLSGGMGSSQWSAPASTSSADTTLATLRKIAQRVRSRFDLNLDPSIKGQILASITTSGQDRWQSFLDIGTDLSLAGQVDEAIWTLAQGVELKPDDPQLVNNFGHVLGLAFDNEDAHAVLLAARELDPQNYYVLANLAYTAYQLKRYDEAELAEQAAVAGNPIPENYWSLCKILTAKHDARANEACQQAQELGIVDILHPGASKPSGGGGGGGGGGSQAPPPDMPPGPDNAPPDDRPDLQAPASNEDQGAAGAATVDPDSNIYGQIGKRNPALDQKPPKPYHFPAAQGEINKEWVGHWEGYKVTGCIHRTRQFGQGLATTYVHENICHYAQKLSLDVTEDGAVSGKGEAVYVFYGKADNMMGMMVPLPMPPGGFFATFPGGYRVRKFEVRGQVEPDGSVFVGGRPEKEMYLLNVYEFQKIYGWNVFPPPENDPGAPGELRISKQGARWVMIGERTNKVSGMRYETTVFKSDRPFSMAKGCTILCPQGGLDKNTKKECQYSLKGGPVQISSDGNDLTATVQGGGVMASVSSTGAAGGKVEAGGAGAGINVGAGGETLGGDISLGGLGVSAEANYGKPGELQKAMAAEKMAGCSTAGPKVGTMKFGMTAGNAGWSVSRNPISGDETFSIGGSASMGGSLGRTQTKASADVRLIVSSKCGVMTTFKVTASKKKANELGPAGRECSQSVSLERTMVWGQSNIAE